MRIGFALGVTLAVGLSAGPALANCDESVVAAVEAIADDPSQPFPEAATALGFQESLFFADCVNGSIIRRLLVAHRNGVIVLPPNLLDAFRFKRPGILNRRTGRD